MGATKYDLRQRRKRRIRSKVFGTAERPRLSVFRSLQGFSAQLIDDQTGATLAAESLKEGNIAGAQKVAKKLAKKYSGECVFDRNGFAYLGRVKAFAESAREAGLQF